MRMAPLVQSTVAWAGATTPTGFLSLSLEQGLNYLHPASHHIRRKMVRLLARRIAYKTALLLRITEKEKTKKETRMSQLQRLQSL